MGKLSVSLLKICRGVRQRFWAFCFHFHTPHYDNFCNIPSFHMDLAQLKNFTLTHRHPRYRIGG